LLCIQNNTKHNNINLDCPNIESKIHTPKAGVHRANKHIAIGVLYNA